MKSHRLLNCIGEIEDRFIAESLESAAPQPARKPTAYRYSRLVKLGTAAAACICLILAGVGVRNGTVKVEPPLPNTKTELPESTAVDPRQKTEEAQDSIFFNELREMIDSELATRGRPVSTKEMDWNSVLEYLGIDPSAPYVPEGLKGSQDNREVRQFGLDESGNIVEDGVWMNYYYDYYEDGSPKSADEISIPAGFDIRYSKLGYANCMVLEDKYVESMIDGQSVVIAHQLLSYGPYDETTHEPSGYYDMYFIEFTIGDVYYEITVRRLSQEVVLNIVSSVIKEHK